MVRGGAGSRSRSGGSTSNRPKGSAPGGSSSLAEVRAITSLTPTTTPRVLAIDDDPQVLALLARIARSTGAEVEAVGRAREALERLSSQRFDVVVSDIRLPDLSGLDLLVEIRRLDIDLPVIFVTGAPSVESAASAIEHGAFRYLTKPFDARELAAAIRQAVQLGRLAAIKRKALEARGLTEGVVADLAGTTARFDAALARVWMAYQPIVTPALEVYGYEALLRCDDPVFTSPGLVFSAAEQLDRVNDVGEVVRALIGPVFERPDAPQAVFVNLHPGELGAADLVNRYRTLAPYASRIVLEITERAMLRTGNGVSHRLSELRGMGYRIAIDDLGAGYASLSSFALLGPEVVKIDMSLVHGIDTEPLKARLLRSICEVCREMGIVVVAEGVETKGQRDAAVELGCDLLQGYLFARPGPAFPTVEG